MSLPPAPPALLHIARCCALTGWGGCRRRKKWEYAIRRQIVVADGVASAPAGGFRYEKRPAAVASPAAKAYAVAKDARGTTLKPQCS